MHKIKIILSTLLWIIALSLPFYVLNLAASLTHQGFELGLAPASNMYKGAIFGMTLLFAVLFISYLCFTDKFKSLHDLIIFGLSVCLTSFIYLTISGSQPALTRSYIHPAMSDETIEFYEKITPKPYCGRGCYQTIEELKSEHGKRIKSGIVEFQSGAIKKGHTYSRLTIEHYLLGDRQPYYFFENDKGGFFAKMYNSVSPFALIIIFFGFVELLSRKPKINKPEEKKPV